MSAIQRTSSYRYWRDEAIGGTSACLMLKERVREAFDVCEGSAGALTIAAIFSQDGTDLSRCIASNLMCELALASIAINEHHKNILLLLICLPVNLLSRTKPGLVW